MATVDKEINVRLSIQPDVAAQAKVDASINQVENSLKRLTVAQGGVASSADKLDSELENVWKKYTDEVLQAKDATDELADSTDQVSQKASGLGGVSGLRRTGGALTQLGLGSIGQPVSQIGDIAQVAKEFGQITDAVKPMVESLSTVGGGIAPLTVAFEGLGGSLGVVAAAAGPLIIAVVGVGLAVKQFTDILKDGANAVQGAIDSQKVYYTAVQTGNSDSIKKQIKDLEDGKAVTDQLASDARNALIKTLTDAANTGDLIKEAEAALAAGPLKAELEKETEASNKAAEAILKLKEALDKIAATDAVLQGASDIAKNEANRQADDALTVDSAKKKLKAQQDLLEQELLERDALVASGDQSEKVQNRIKELNKAIGDTSDEIDYLRIHIIPAKKAIEDHAKALDDANKSAVAAAKAEEAKNKSLADAVKKYDDDVSKITEQGIQDRLNIEKKYQDTLVQIATKAAQEAQDDLRKLKDQESQNLESFNRNEQDANAKARFDAQTVQIKAQQEETKELVDHQRKLEDIRKQGRDQEMGFLLNRDFLGLLQSRISTSQSMQNENTSFTRSQQDKSAARQQQGSDNARQLEFDHQQRIIAYQRANQDAERNYQIQIRDQQISAQRARQAALLGEQQQLSDLQKKIQNELTLRRQGIVAELQLINMGDKEKLAMEKQYLAQSKQLLKGAMDAPRTAAAATINYTQHISTPNANPVQIAAIAGKQSIEFLRRITGAGA